MLLALGLAACGGGGGGGSSPSTDGHGPGGVPKGIEGTGKVVSHGSITAFGSIFVNGVEYSTDKAAIQVDGRSVSESELKLGQVVTVVGTLNEADRTKAVADTVTFTAPIVGPVQSIDAAQASLVVLGQPVLIDGATRFDEDITPASLAGLAVGMEIEVSGFRDSRGVLAARSIARRGAGQSLASTGDAAGVDAVAGSTVSDAKPLLSLLVAGSFLFAAAGLEWVRARSPGYVALVGVVIALGLMSCVNSLVLAGRAQGATFDEALDQVVDEFLGPTAMVADSAEVDRRLAGAMARAGWRNQWVRVAQDSTAIRQAIAEGRQVLAFDESAAALEALGWALTSPREWTVGSPGRRVVKVWSVEPPGA